MNTRNAYIACAKLAKDFRKNYIDKSTEAARNSKYFDIGFDGYYDGVEHLALLAKFGFNSVDEFNEAVEKSDWAIAYEQASLILKLAPHNSVEYKNIVAGWKDAGYWSEEDHKLSGVEMYAIAKSAAPKYAQLIELTVELGLEIPRKWSY